MIVHLLMYIVFVSCVLMNKVVVYQTLTHVNTTDNQTGRLYCMNLVFYSVLDDLHFNLLHKCGVRILELTR